MRFSYKFNTLAIAVSSLCAASVANAAGLDRSGQDTTAFFQDGTYFETTYSYIDADVTGRDSSGNKIDDIAEDYDFFRYGVKTDIDDTFSIGVLYDEPWGAAADYVGDNDFVGVADRTGAGAIIRIANNAIANTENKIQTVQALKNSIDPATQPLADTVYDSALNGLNQTLTNFQELSKQPTLDKLDSVVTASNQNLEASKQTLNKIESLLDPQTKQTAESLVQANEQDVRGVMGAQAVIEDLYSIDQETNVEVRTQSITGLLGMRFGENKEFQVYGGPVAQRLKAEVHLRGNAYEGASGYDLSINPDVDYGWIAGLQYSKPEIALKASLTYRSEIDHDMPAAEVFPLSAFQGYDSVQTNPMEVTTPESVNFDFQTGINPTTLATARVRWVPWGDFAITPPLYNLTSKASFPAGLNLVDYEDDQWVVELGLAKRLNPALAVSGSLGWDSGAGNPTTSLGPIEGYYSVGAGAKYNLTENWAVSAGGKYLWFGDADGRIPSGSIVSDFEDNDGFIVGVKVSYQDK